MSSDSRGLSQDLRLMAVAALGCQEDSILSSVGSLSSRRARVDLDIQYESFEAV